LEHQVRITDLPWVAAVANVRVDDADTQAEAHRTLARIAQAALRSFPGSVLPSPLIAEFNTLAVQAGLDIPWVEEPAADIFKGRFTAKFLKAAQIAARILRGSLYERYYDIDHTAIAAIDDVIRRKPPGTPGCPPAGCSRMSRTRNGRAGACHRRRPLRPPRRGWQRTTPPGMDDDRSLDARRASRPFRQHHEALAVRT